MSIARQLFELQELDLDIESRQRTLESLTAQLGESEAVKRAREETGSRRQKLDELKRQQHGLEYQIDDLGAKLGTTEEKLYGGTVRNPKELANLQQEAEALKSKRRQLEDRVLELMAQIEEVQAALTARTAELKALEAASQIEQQRLSAEIKELKATLAGLENKRQNLLMTAPSQAVQFYNKLREQKGTAVARVEQGRCCGCRIQLSIAELQRSRNSLVQCSSCGRILYAP